jgi:hypothetical protein
MKLLKISGKSIKMGLLHQQKTSLALKKEIGMSGMMEECRRLVEERKKARLKLL